MSGNLIRGLFLNFAEDVMSVQCKLDAHEIDEAEVRRRVLALADRAYASLGQIVSDDVSDSDAVSRS